MHKKFHSQPGAVTSCDLRNFGISPSVVRGLIVDIVAWMEGKNLKWHQSKFIALHVGPKDENIVELMFFHYDGLPGREFGGGGEDNCAKLYLYPDHCKLSFVGEDANYECGLRFKYTSKWEDTDSVLCLFLFRYLNDHVLHLYNTAPQRFDGTDREVEAFKSMMQLMDSLIIPHTEPLVA